MSITPSPFASTAQTILRQSRKLHLSPSLFNNSNTSSAHIFPSPSESNGQNGHCMSIVVTPPSILCNSTNSLKSINPSPSKSTAFNILGTSFIMFSFPSAHSMALHSPREIFPSLLESIFFASSPKFGRKAGIKLAFSMSLKGNIRFGFRKNFIIKRLYWNSRILIFHMFFCWCAEQLRAIAYQERDLRKYLVDPEVLLYPVGGTDDVDFPQSKV